MEFEDRITWFAILALLIGIGLVTTAYRMKAKAWVGPKQVGPRSKPLWYLYAGAMVVLMVMAAIGRYVMHEPLYGIAAAAFVFVSSLGALPAIDRALQEDIRAGEAGGIK